MNMSGDEYNGNGNNNDIIASSLGIKPIDYVEDEHGNLVPKEEEIKEKQGVGFEDVREKIRDAAQLGSEKLQEIGELASASQHPRSYEAFTVLLKEVISAQKELLELQKAEDAKQEEAQNPGTSTDKNITNNLFVGSTAELQEYLENHNKNKNK